MSLKGAKMPSLAEKIEAQAKAQKLDELEGLEEILEAPRVKGKKGRKKAGN